MTITSIGILLSVIAVVLWAIMAALHRHTQEMITLRAHIQALVDASAATQNSTSTTRHRSTERPASNVRGITSANAGEAVMLYQP